MDTNRLRQFVILAEIGNMRRAAEMLRISHSGLSKSIRALEEELDTTLTLPDGRGLVITDSGRKIYEHAKTLLAAEEEFLGRVKDGRTSETELRLGTFEVFSTYFLSEVWQLEFDERSLLIRELIPGEMEEQIAVGNVDYGITYIPIPRSELEYLKVAKLSMGLFTVNKNYLDVHWSELPFCAPAVPVHGSPTQVKGLDGWPDDRLSRRIVYRVELMESALALVRRGYGVIYLPRFVARMHNETVIKRLQLREIPLPSKELGKTDRDIYLIKRKAMPESSDERKLARGLRRLCK